MTDPQVSFEASMAKTIEVTMLMLADPEIGPAKSTPEPQRTYVEAMAKCPVRQMSDDVFLLTKMEDIRYVTKHHDVEQASKYLGSDRPAIPLGLDGPEHRKYRKLLDPVFTAKRVAPLADNVRSLANEMIDRFIDHGEVDAYAVWCEPLPSTIFLSIMGLPMEDLDAFLHFKNLTLGHNREESGTPEEQMAQRAEAAGWLNDYFTRDLDAREREAGHRDDMIGWLLEAEVDSHRLTREDTLGILSLLMIAGLDTVAASLACFLSYFARHPDDRRRIVEQPDLIRPAVEELMRFESPVTDGFRIANAELTLPSGTKIPAGAWMDVSWQTANLDPSVFENPLEVDFERNPNPHIGFASGFHRCLGSHLARMEMCTALNVWHERIPDYQIKAGEDLVYSPNPRAPHHLWLTWS